MYHPIVLVVYYQAIPKTPYRGEVLPDLSPKQAWFAGKSLKMHTDLYLPKLKEALEKDGRIVNELSLPVSLFEIPIYIDII